jgi:hypothetical protein
MISWYIFTGFLLQKLKCFLITDMCHVQSCDNFLTLVGLNLLVLTGFMEEAVFWSLLQMALNLGSRSVSLSIMVLQLWRREILLYIQSKQLVLSSRKPNYLKRNSYWNFTSVKRYAWQNLKLSRWVGTFKKISRRFLEQFDRGQLEEAFL